MHLGFQRTFLSPNEISLLILARNTVASKYIPVKYILRQIFLYRKILLPWDMKIHAFCAASLFIHLHGFIVNNSNNVAIHKFNNNLASWDEKTILYRKLSSSFACGALKLSHTISANHGGSILRGNLSVRNIIARRTKSCFDGYSRGIGLLEFTHIIAFHRGVSNFRHMQDAVSLLCIRSLYIRTILHDVLSPSFV